MELSKGFIATEIGSVPADWSVKKCAEFSNPVRGGSPRPAGDPRYFDGNYIPWLTVTALTNIPDSQIEVRSTANFLTEEGSHFSRTLEPGTLIIANSGATLGVAKILAIKCCANDGIAALLNLSKDVVPHYVALYINTRTKFLREVVATGNGQPNLNTHLIGDFKVPIPPRHEQEAIAIAIKDVDGFIESIEQLLSKKHLVKRGAMQQLLTGKRRLPGYTESWKKKSVGRLLKVEHGKSQRGVEIEGGIYPILATGGRIGSTNTFLYDKPSVLIGRKGTIDKPQYMDTPFWTVDTLFYSTILDDNDAKFLYYRFCLIDWKQYNEASGVPSLNARTIESIEILVPDPVEQREISKVLSAIDSDIAINQERLKKARQIKQGMLRELLNGRIRLL